MPQLALRGTKGLRHPKVDLYFPHIKLCEGWPWTWNLNDSNEKKLEQTEIYLQMIHFPLPIWLYPECKLWDMVGSQPAHTSLQPKIYLLNSIICKFIHYHFPSFPPEHPYSSLLTPLQNCRYPPPRHMLSCHQHQLHRYQQWVDHVLLPSGWHLPDPRCHNKQPQRIHLNQTNDGGGGIEIDCWLVNVNENQVCFFGYIEVILFHEFWVDFWYLEGSDLVFDDHFWEATLFLKLYTLQSHWSHASIHSNQTN